MESVLWFLIMGALFFFMMKFGCGAHMGGHGGHGEHEGMDGTAPSEKAKDPVCRMEINKDQAYAMIQRNGKQIYFCSADCQDKFNKDPKRYL